MRGDDVLGVELDGESKPLLVKVEAKSSAALGATTVKEARKGLARANEMPSPHSLSQFAERLLRTSDRAFGEAILTLQLVEGVRPERVRHIMFLFTASDPSRHIAADLTAYAGSVPQRTITLRVSGHRQFIKDAFEKVTTVAS